jgi:hypothetical protein
MDTIQWICWEYLVQLWLPVAIIMARTAITGDRIPCNMISQPIL